MAKSEGERHKIIGIVPAFTITVILCILKGYQAVIHLILDGAGYHRSKVVKKKAKELGIILHYLPPYSPNLNSIERLWKVMNEHARNNKYFATVKEFRQSIGKFLMRHYPELAVL